MPTNLNSLEPDVDCGPPGGKVNNDNSCASIDGTTHVYFRDLVDRLTELIKGADAVFGCVAWLTHPEILAALRGRSCAIVVQKEDFLRPDLGVAGGWKTQLRASYEALHCELNRFDFDSTMISRLSTFSDTSIEAVRCVGNYNREKVPAFPRMHNKFLLMAKVRESNGVMVIAPYGVWTGSFNLTKNAGASLENALFLTDRNLVQAYLQEFAQIMALSEPLNWESEWCTPEWRIGT